MIVTDCLFYSCSLLCFKAHKIQCVQTAIEVTTATIPVKPKAGSEDNILLGDALIQDPRLQTLFEQYPNLRAKLKYIFDHAMADQDDHNQSMSKARRQNYQTSPQKRMAHALRVLASQLSSDTAATSGLGAFADLVAELKSRESDEELAGANVMP